MSKPDFELIPLDSIELATAEVTNTEDSETRLYPISPKRKEKLIAYSKFRNIWRFGKIKGLLILITVGIVSVLFYLVERTRRWWLWFSITSIPIHGFFHSHPALDKRMDFVRNYQR